MLEFYRILSLRIMDKKTPKNFHDNKRSLFGFHPKTQEGDDEDEGGSGGKKLKLSNAPVESTISKNKKNRKLADRRDADNIEKARFEHEEKRIDTQKEDSNRYLRELAKNHYQDGLFNAENVLFYSDYFKQEVEFSTILTIEDQLRYGEITGSITNQLTGESGKSIFSREDEAPIVNWHGTQWYSSHVETWADSRLHNPHVSNEFFHELSLFKTHKPTDNNTQRYAALNKIGGFAPKPTQVSAIHPKINTSAHFSFKPEPPIETPTFDPNSLKQKKT